MNQIGNDFEAAQSVNARSFLGIPEGDTQDYMIVTSLDLRNSMSLALATSHPVLKIALVRELDADDALNKVVLWMMKHDVFNQWSIHGENLAEYSVGFYKLEGQNSRETTLSQVQDFYLTDFVFDHNKDLPLKDFDDLMYALDRHMLGGAMRRALVEEMGVVEREAAPAFWLRDIRVCSHPDSDLIALKNAILDRRLAI